MSRATNPRQLSDTIKRLHAALGDQPDYQLHRAIVDLVEMVGKDTQQARDPGIPIPILKQYAHILFYRQIELESDHSFPEPKRRSEALRDGSAALGIDLKSVYGRAPAEQRDYGVSRKVA